MKKAVLSAVVAVMSLILVLSRTAYTYSGSGVFLEETSVWLSLQYRP